MIDAITPPTRREDGSEAAMSDRPVLAVIPLPARLEVAAAVLGALADVWEDHHGQVLTMSDAPEESTPWGRALVIRKPGPPAGPADGEVVPDTEIPPRDPAAASLDRAVRAVLDHRWGDWPKAAHAEHIRDSGCAVCQGEVAAVLAVAAPLIAGQERARIADQLRANAERFRAIPDEGLSVGQLWHRHEQAGEYDRIASAIESG